MGDRVFDVIGQLLQLNDIRFEEMVREATYAKASEDEVLEQIEQLDPKRIEELEQATGVALATSQCGFVPSALKTKITSPRATVDATLCRGIFKRTCEFYKQSGDSRRWIVAHPLRQGRVLWQI